MDFIFSHDHPEFMTAKETTVEKLGHALHMTEMWTRAQKEYNRYFPNFKSSKGFTDLGREH